MTQVTEAIHSGGVLRPLDDLGLREDQRVRLIVQPLEEAKQDWRDAALGRLRDGIARMNFFSAGPLPTRAELHDRS